MASTQTTTAPGEWKTANRGLAKTGGWYSRRGKRLFDVVASVAGLVVLSPGFLILFVTYKVFSPGPFLYRQERIGIGGRVFYILKFRTMVVHADRIGPGITASGDRRITRLGKLLRRFKIDELPQLWNVLKGEMSLVAPRPELPCYVADYTELQRRVLRVRPGMTDPASLLYRNEEEVLGQCPEPELQYRNVVLPHKLELNLEYLSKVSFIRDLALICETLRATF
jgi:lipopolysaccharide/colanic/teichoic acid biosynthesis glycosyltransferase